MPKPVRSPQATIARQLQGTIDRLQATTRKTPQYQVIERSVSALQVDQQFVASLLMWHPIPDMDAMTRVECEEWMAAGAPDAQCMPPAMLQAHVARVLSALVADSEEIKILGADLEFLTTLAKMSPGVSIWQLTPESRAFVLWIAKTIGCDGSETITHRAIIHYVSITKILAEAIEYEGVKFALLGEDIDWQDFFYQIFNPQNHEQNSSNYPQCLYATDRDRLDRL